MRFFEGGDAEEAGVALAIPRDDLPWPLPGLPRLVSESADLDTIMNAAHARANGMTFCASSLGAGSKNNVAAIAARFAERINFIHLRNGAKNAELDFIEEHCFEDVVDMYAVMKALLLEQKGRMESGRADTRMPMRPDHGHLMRLDQSPTGFYPGYSLPGRMRGLRSCAVWSRGFSALCGKDEWAHQVCAFADFIARKSMRSWRHKSFPPPQSFSHKHVRKKLLAILPKILLLFASSVSLNQHGWRSLATALEETILIPIPG